MSSRTRIKKDMNLPQVLAICKIGRMPSLHKFWNKIRFNGLQKASPSVSLYGWAKRCLNSFIYCICVFSCPLTTLKGIKKLSNKF